MSNLKSDLKTKKFEGVYMLMGKEKFLIDINEKRMLDALIPKGFTEMNLSLMEGEKATASAIIDATETLPFMSDVKITLVRNSNLFTSKRKEEAEKLSEYISTDYNKEGNILLFIEENVDKRTKLYKTVNKSGVMYNYDPLKESEIVIWITGEMRKNNLSISSSDAAYLLRITNGSMEAIHNEMQKLFSFKQEGQIYKSDIDAICTKTSEAKIFDLMDYVSVKKQCEALSIYKELLMMKETPIGILAIIGRQFRLILKTKLLLEKGYNYNTIAERLGEHPYSIKMCQKQTRGYSVDALKQAVLDCVCADTRIKSGRLDGKLSVELLIIKYSGEKYIV